MTFRIVELIEASGALEQLGALAEGFHNEHPLAKKAVEMRLILIMANSYLVDFVKALQARPGDG
jgi:hypothetical protein